MEKDKIKDWILQKMKSPRNKGFKIEVIEKDLKIDKEEAYKYCVELVKEGLLTMEYHLLCDKCEFSNIYIDIKEIPSSCEWCHKELSIRENVYTAFLYKNNK